MKLRIRQLFFNPLFCNPFAFVLFILALGACSKKDAGTPVQNDEANVQRQDPQLVTPQTAKLIEENALKNTSVRVGLLYFQDAKTHRDAMLKWLKAHGASVEFESEVVGYLDATLTWKDLSKLIESRGSVGLDRTSVMKLEIEKQNSDGTSNNAHLEIGAGQPFLGAGTRVGVFDLGLDFSRIDVLGDRLIDALVGDVNGWQDIEPPQAYLNKGELTAGDVGKALEGLRDNPTLGFVKLKESDFNFDLNNSGSESDALTVVYFEENSKHFIQVQPAAGMPFGPRIPEFGSDHSSKTIFDPATGRPYVRRTSSPSASALAFQIEKANAKTKIAFLGDPAKGQHGIANLHMVGGNYQSSIGAEVYQGVAPQTKFVHMQTWSRSSYGQNWLSLARSIALGTENKLDVLDLDIYVPGVRGAEDLLSALLCRVVKSSNTVPVVAAHNYGPLPQTIQNLAESPCIITVGASHSRAALLQGYQSPQVHPTLTNDQDVYTANYSGRGFASKGLLKPDIISPAYAYTAYGQGFIRFDGTSGATPTTAGAIAVLKEAARFLGTELNFFQTRMLLMAGSRVSANPREGYGFTDIYNSWKILKDLYGQKNLDPIWITQRAGPRLSWSRRPEAQTIRIQLKREIIPNGQNKPRRMKVWMEHSPSLGNLSAGDSWIRVSDANGNPLGQPQQNTFTIDIPMEGEVFNLFLQMGISETAWAKLQPGDHVSVVKMVREELEGTGVVDFVMPLSLQKSIQIVQEKILTFEGLHAEEVKSFYLDSKPGDTFSVAGDLVCVDKNGQEVDFGGTPSQVYMYVDPDYGHNHASEIMSGYSSFMLTKAPVYFTSQREHVPFAISRESKDGDNCAGALRGKLWVRKVSPFIQNQNPRVSIQADQVKMESKLEGELFKSLTYTTHPQLFVESTELIASKESPDAIEWSNTVPSSLLARSGGGAFAMILGSIQKDAKWKEIQRSEIDYQDGVQAPDPSLYPKDAGALTAALKSGTYRLISTCPVSKTIQDCLQVKLSFPLLAETELIRSKQNAKFWSLKSVVKKDVVDRISKELGPGWHLQIQHNLAVRENQTGQSIFGVGVHLQDAPAGEASFALP